VQLLALHCCLAYRTNKQRDDTANLLKHHHLADLMSDRQAAWGEGCISLMCCQQTYEGGIGGEPGNEAHGGYTFCGLAAAALAGAAQALDLDSLTRWAASCQVPLSTAGPRGEQHAHIQQLMCSGLCGVYPALTLSCCKPWEKTHTIFSHRH
jgi:prenyltransferase beta subunit